MITPTSTTPIRSAFSFWLLLVSLTISALQPALAATDKTAAPAMNGPAYQAGAVSQDFRNISTLSDFTRLVYRDRWSNIEAEDVLAELKKFNGAPNSPALRDSWRDVLLGDFEGMKFDNAQQQTDMMAERLRILNRLGYFDEAVRLYQQAAQKKPIASRIAFQGIEALALSGSADGACLEVYMAAQYLQGDDWSQDNALCAAYFGETERAKKLYDEVGTKAGGGFRTVYKMLTGTSGKAIQVGIPALWRTLLLAKGATVTTDALQKADATTLASLAVNKNVPLGTRISAALRAADKGTIGFERLRKLYEAKYPADNGLNAIYEGAKAGNAMGQPEYYTAARFMFEGAQRSQIVKNAIHHINPVTNVKSQVYGWIVDKLTLQPANKIALFAPEAYSVMATTNRLASAQIYYNAGNLQNSPFAIIQALLEGKKWNLADRQVWEDAMNKKYGAQASEKIKVMLDTAKAYDSEQKLALVDPKVRDDSSSKPSALAESIRKGGRGLTLVTALNALAKDKKLTNIPADQFIGIIRDMSKEGLFGERKKLSLEFLIQSVL